MTPALQLHRPIDNKIVCGWVLDDPRPSNFIDSQILKSYVWNTKMVMPCPQNL